MSCATTNDWEDGMVSKDQTDYSPIDEESCGGMGAVPALKKGPWTSAEDAILVEYVKNHGEGNWNAVQKHTGLTRCGKSCRLRWANHLRPNLKKGAFSQEEERLIVELHAQMGNKWARMAAHLPGRTDNEIKNYWNTRVKRRQRAGLSLYPSDLQTLNEGQQNQNYSEWSSSDTQHNNELLPTDSYIPEVFFDNLEANNGPSFFAPALHDISVNDMASQALGSLQNYNFMSPTMHRATRPRESDALLPGFLGGDTDRFPLFDLINISPCKKICRSFGPGFSYNADPNNKNPAPFGASVTGNHAFLDSNGSSLKPISEVAKLELPSLQNLESIINSWGTYPLEPPSPPPPLESIDAYIQSPPAMQVRSDCSSPWNSGLLEEVIYESHAKSRSSEKSYNSSVVKPADGNDNLTPELCEGEWGDFGDPISPLGCSSASVFSEHTHISGSSVDESSPVKAFIDGGDKEMSTQSDVFRADALLGLDCFEQSSDYFAKDLAAFLGENFGSDYQHLASAASTSSQGWVFGSCAWNNMPAACQISELPSDNVYGASQ